MAKNVPTILSLGAALASLQGVSALNATPTAASIPSSDKANATQMGCTAKGDPNIFMSVGSDLLGLIVTKTTNGTVVADHYSHASHSSHSSHYSGR